MTDYFKGLPMVAQTVAKLGLVGAVVALMGYQVFTREASQAKFVDAVMQQNAVNAETHRAQTEILSRHTDQLADIKNTSDRTSRLAEKIADSLNVRNSVTSTEASRSSREQ